MSSIKDACHEVYNFLMVLMNSAFVTCIQNEMIIMVIIIIIKTQKRHRKKVKVSSWKLA